MGVNGTLNIEATVDNLGKVNEFIEGKLEEAGCPDLLMMTIELAVEEVFVNIAHYAYGKVDESGNAIPDTGTGPARIDVSAGDGEVAGVVVEEQGLHIVEAALGGIGILHAANPQMAGQLIQFAIGENLAQQALPPVPVTLPFMVEGDNTAAFLPPVLKVVQTIIDESGRVFHAIYSQNTHITKSLLGSNGPGQSCNFPPRGSGPGGNGPCPAARP